ncbi:MAG: hypothetical protein K0R78_2413 [Pelosinus sp.]|jgi:hypothetical protein|nr:hypothetical protein [Pelosinus sp.]
MKKNVYDQVQVFYDEAIVWEPIIQQEWVEGFLRQKAWQGISDDKLKDIWHPIQLFILYLTHFNNEDLDEISLAEYSFMVKWLSENVGSFKTTLKSVRHFFNVLIEFYTYLFSKKIVMSLDEIKEAAQEISGGRKINLLKSESIIEGLQNMEDASNEQFDDKVPFGIVIGEAVESLMLKLGKYFQQQEFTEDFERALYLYTGPFDNVSEEVEEDFWLGFWDYFLFDYHLLENDLKPLEYFNSTCSERLNKDEYQILQSLLGSSFTVFYIKRIISQDLVECVNLFTSETFQLPTPDFDYKTLKNLLFFGHIFSQGLVMINYVTSLQVSINLRNRIRDEVLRQKEIFSIQEPEATLEEFFKRHALVVRHTINILVTLAKVNVTSLNQLERSYPTIEEKRIPNNGVSGLLHDLVVEYGLSHFDEKLLGKMWYDFSQISVVNVRKSIIWATALLLTYIQVNGVNNITAEQIADKAGISITSILKKRTQLYEVLELEKFDPRYLSEDGFVISLFAE